MVVGSKWGKAAILFQPDNDPKYQKGSYVDTFFERHQSQVVTYLETLRSPCSHNTSWPSSRGSGVNPLAPGNRRRACINAPFLQSIKILVVECHSPAPFWVLQNSISDLQPLFSKKTDPTPFSHFHTRFLGISEKSKYLAVYKKINHENYYGL